MSRAGVRSRVRQCLTFVSLASRTAFTYGLRPHNGQDTLAIRTNNVAAPQIQPPAAPASRSHSASSTSRGNSETGEAVVPVSQPESSQVKSSQTTKTKRTTAVVETKPTVATRKVGVLVRACRTTDMLGLTHSVSHRQKSRPMQFPHLQQARACRRDVQRGQLERERERQEQRKRARQLREPKERPRRQLPWKPTARQR